MRATFRSLRVRNYRLFASGQLVSLVGTWMQRTGQDWLVVSRLAPHNRGTAAGITLGLQFLPLLLFGLHAGVIADRFPKRRLLILTQSAMGVIALVLGLLVATDAVTLHEVYLLAFLLGCATALDNPVRQSFVSELVGREEISNAVGLNSATFNSARLIGPAVAGLMIETVGTSWVFFSNAASFIGVLAGLAMMRDAELFPSPRLERAKGQVREGLAYVARRRELVLPVVLMGVVGMLGFNFQITLALMAKTVFHRGAGSYGLLSTAIAIGSVAGSLLGASRTRPSVRFLALMAGAFGVTEALAGLMPDYLSSGAVLIPVGLTSMLLTTSANSTMQLRTDPAMRGRVMAVYMIVFAGTTPIGAPLVGWLSQVFGARFGLVVGGASSIVVAGVVAAIATHDARTRAVPDGALADRAVPDGALADRAPASEPDRPEARPGPSVTRKRRAVFPGRHEPWPDAARRSAS